MNAQGIQANKTTNIHKSTSLDLMIKSLYKLVPKFSGDTSTHPSNTSWKGSLQLGLPKHQSSWFAYSSTSQTIVYIQIIGAVCYVMILILWLWSPRFKSPWSIPGCTDEHALRRKGLLYFAAWLYYSTNLNITFIGPGFHRNCWKQLLEFP